MSTDDNETPVRSLGTLKLPESDVQPFLDALEFYGHERVAAYLRVTAYSLIKHHQAQDKLAAPLGFEPVPKVQETKRLPFITRGALFGLPLAALPGILACLWEINERIVQGPEHPVSSTVYPRGPHLVHDPIWVSFK